MDINIPLMLESEIRKENLSLEDYCSLLKQIEPIPGKVDIRYERKWCSVDENGLTHNHTTYINTNIETFVSVVEKLKYEADICEWIHDIDRLKSAEFVHGFVNELGGQPGIFDPAEPDWVDFLMEYAEDLIADPEVGISRSREPLRTYRWHIESGLERLAQFAEPAKAQTLHVYRERLADWCA